MDTQDDARVHWLGACLVRPVVMESACKSFWRVVADSILPPISGLTPPARRHDDTEQTGHHQLHCPPTFLLMQVVPHAHRYALRPPRCQLDADSLSLSRFGVVYPPLDAHSPRLRARIPPTGSSSLVQLLELLNDVLWPFHGGAVLPLDRYRECDLLLVFSPFSD